ncbi:LytR C-terminal domain-containing protein [Patescibacteria group bacterium]|nr:LytR C-terminal domain-containing protein [Patescibacteria group bacterium]
MEEEEKTSDKPQEEEKEETPNTQETETTRKESREARREKRKGRRIGRRGILILLIIIALVAGVLIFMRQNPTIEIEPDKTTSIDETSTATSPTPSPEPIKRDEATIQVLNGTGIAKEAGFLQGQLEDLGYSQIDVGNADEEDYVKTTVTFLSSLPKKVVDEITAELEEIYKEVETKTTDSEGDYQVQIITGYRKGHTPTPTEAATPTPTPEEDVTPTATPSATPSI